MKIPVKNIYPMFKKEKFKKICDKIEYNNNNIKYNIIINDTIIGSKYWNEIYKEFLTTYSKYELKNDFNKILVGEFCMRGCIKYPNCKYIKKIKGININDRI